MGSPSKRAARCGVDAMPHTADRRDDDAELEAAIRHAASAGLCSGADPGPPPARIAAALRAELVIILEIIDDERTRP